MILINIHGPINKLWDVSDLELNQQVSMRIHWEICRFFQDFGLNWTAVSQTSFRSNLSAERPPLTNPHVNRIS